MEKYEKYQYYLVCLELWKELILQSDSFRFFYPFDAKLVTSLTFIGINIRLLRGIYTVSGKAALSKLFCFHCEKESTLKGSHKSCLSCKKKA